MKILSVLGDETSLRVQSINGMLFVEEDWMKKIKEEREQENKDPKNK